MYHAFYEANRFLHGPIFASLLFVSLFAVVFVWVARTRPAQFEHQASLPLDDGTPVSPEARAPRAEGSRQP